MEYIINPVKCCWSCCCRCLCIPQIRRDLQQINALINKTITLQLRHWCTNILQISLPIFVLLTILLFQWLSDEIMQPMLQMMLPEDAGGEQESLDVDAIPLDITTMQAIVLSQNNSIPFQYMYSLDDGVDEDLFGTYSDYASTGLLSLTPNIMTYFPYYDDDGGISFRKTATYQKFDNEDKMDEELYDLLVEAQGEDSTSIDIIGGYSIHTLNNEEFSYTVQFENEIERKVKPSSAIEMDAAAMGVDLNISKDSKTDFCKMSGYISMSFECENLMKTSLINELNHAYIMDNSGTYVTTRVSQFPFHREKYVIKMRYDEASGGYFFPMVILLLLPVFTYNLVLEKENQIREMMKLMGMRTRNYVAVHVVSMFIMYVISQCVFVLLAYFAFRFRYFTQTDPFLLLVLFITCGFHLISVSFLMSSALSSTLLATVLGYLIVLIAPSVFVTVDTLVSLPMNWEFVPNLVIWKLLNFIPLWGICDLFYYSTKACITMNCMEFMGLFYNYDMLFAFVIMNFTTILYFILSFYFEAVLPQKWGVRKNPCFCMESIFKCCCWCCPCYWKNYCDFSFVKDKIMYFIDEEEEEEDEDEEETQNDFKSTLKKYMRMIMNKKGRSKNRDDINDDDEDEDEDVRNERLFISKGIKNKNKFGVIVNKLVKKYGRKKLAVDKVHFKIPHGECFSLLGPNGAGKTTTIRMLCGLFAPTSGEAYVNGKSIRREMGQIWAKMGLCPQFDVIWPEMTAREHLLFYARLKGVPAIREHIEVDDILCKVGIQKGTPNMCKSLCNRIFGMIFPCEKKAKSLPLGERRRLSIGISLIGSPEILFLDEPTTGLDIESRKAVWDLIEEEKKNKCVILTTHSMEEADVLSDRIGIMARGKMKCIGTNFHLKSKFGTGFTLKVNYDKSKRTEVDEFIDNLIPSYRLVKDFGESLTWEIDLSQKKEEEEEECKISHIFSEIELHREELGIQDWAIQQPTLEDVFLNIITEDEEKYVLENDIARRKGLKGWKKWWHCWKWGKSKKLDDDEKMIIEKLEEELKEKKKEIRRKRDRFRSDDDDDGMARCLSCSKSFSSEIEVLEHFFVKHEGEYERLSSRQLKMINERELEDLDNIDEKGEDDIDEFDIQSDGHSSDSPNERETLYVAEVKESSSSSSEREEEEEEEDSLEEGGEVEEVIIDIAGEDNDSSFSSSRSGSYSSRSRSTSFSSSSYTPTEESEPEEEEERVTVHSVNLDENKRDFIGTIGNHYYRVFSTHCFFLTLKNILLSIRKWRTTCFQIFIPVLLTLLLLFMYLLGKIDNDSTYVHPETKEIPDFVECKEWNGQGCYSLAFTTNGNEFAELVMHKVITENPNLSPYVRFLNDEYLLAYLSNSEKSNMTQSAVSFNQTEFIGSMRYVDYILYYNATTLSNPNGDTVSQSTQLKVEIDNAILELSGGEGQIEVQLKGFPKVPISGGAAPFDIYRSTGPAFLGLTAFFILSCALFSIVSEKPKKKALRIVGMDNMAYWISWYCVWVAVAIAAAIVQVLIGMICWIPNFLYANVLISFIYHFLYYVSILSLAPLISVFLNTTKSTLLFSFIMVFVAVFMNFMLDANLIYSLFDQEGKPDNLMELEERMLPWYFSVFYPPFNYAKIYADIGFKTFPVLDYDTNEYEKNEGYGFDDLFRENENKTLEMHAPASIYALLFLILNTIIFLLLSWYFDNVFSEKHSYLFFLTPSYWRIDFKECLGYDGEKKEFEDLDVADEDEADDEENEERRRKVLRQFSGSRSNLIDYCCCTMNKFKPKPSREKPTGEDTWREYEWIRGYHQEEGNKPILQIIDLLKTYSTLTFFRRKKAVRGINLGLAGSSCLVLLGPNGAGKSTLLDCISGHHKFSTYSDIRVFGRSVKKDLPLIRPHFGVVDQYDLLWDDLSAREHIILFSIFKPNREMGILEEVKLRLNEVGLWDDRGGLSKTFSGGMKRRLSVAIGMCGNPSLLLLDEPSTGVDPYSKREMWNLIYSLKKVKGVLLTTHSMEEAEALSDRIAVVKEGKLLAIGDPLSLKSSFGAGYTLTLEMNVVDEEKIDEVKEKFTEWLVEQRLESMDLEWKSEELVELDIPTDYSSEEILRILYAVEEEEEKKSEETVIKNWGISKKTLEQVYIKLMREGNGENETKEEEEEE